MRAATITVHGQAPTNAELAEPAGEENRLIVATAAVPITPLDLLCASGTSYFGPPALPYVPGVQGVGVVRSGPPKLVGRHVWFATTAGMAPGDGSMSELCAVDEADVVELPPGVDDGVAAALGLSAVAAWEMLEGRARLQAGEQVLVLG